MTRPQILCIRTRLALAAAALCLALPLLLLRPHPASAAQKTALHCVTGPLGTVPGQTAEMAFFLPGTPSVDRVPARVRLVLLNAITGEQLASKDFQVGVGPGGGCLEWENTGVNQDGPGERTEVDGVLIGLLRPSADLPSASLQVLDTRTQKTLVALPAVQHPSGVN